MYRLKIPLSFGGEIMPAGASIGALPADLQEALIKAGSAEDDSLVKTAEEKPKQAPKKVK